MTYRDRVLNGSLGSKMVEEIEINCAGRCLDDDGSIEAQTKKINPIPTRPKFKIGNASFGGYNQESITSIPEQIRTDSFSTNNSQNYDHRNEVVINEHDRNYRWVDNRIAKNSVANALSVFYAFVITIFALVFELSHLLSEQKMHNKDMVFGMYMYGGSILFLFYCYVVLLLNPQWRKAIEKVKTIVNLNKINVESNIALDETSIRKFGKSSIGMTRKVSHDSPSAGSLFLRLGCVVFGVVGIVYYAFRVFLCVADLHCGHPTVVLNICAIVFIFMQMHFIFCNWKINIGGSHTIARFGTMHLVAANLWTWIRYVLMEEGVMDKEIGEIFVESATSPNKTDGNVINPSEVLADTKNSDDEYQAIDIILGSITDLMYTSLVEYSLISAAVMFIVWRNIGNVKIPSEYVKRKYHIRINCSKTTTGLFFGLAFLAGSFTSMAVFYGYTITNKNQTASLVFSITDIVQYVITGLVCICALWQMRLLRYYDNRGNKQREHINPNQELLDTILLSLGMIGEMIYSVAGLVGLTGENEWQALSIVLFIGHVTRLVQVGIQACLIYISAKLRIQGDLYLRDHQPGKQAITFLLIANISMFLMNLFESEKAGVSETVVNFYGEKSWVFLIRTFSPLTIFYRFHSSVCLAEIWKNAYTWKE